VQPQGIARISVHYEEYGEHLAAVLAKRRREELTAIRSTILFRSSTRPASAEALHHFPGRNLMVNRSLDYVVGVVAPRTAAVDPANVRIFRAGCGQ